MTTSGYEIAKYSVNILIDLWIVVAAWVHLYTKRESKYTWREVVSTILMFVGLAFLGFDIKNLVLLLQ